MKGRKLGLKLMIWKRRKKSIFTQNRMKKQEFKTMRRLRNLQDIFKHSIIQIMVVPEKEEEDQGIENLFEKIMKERLSSLIKEMDF